MSCIDMKILLKDAQKRKYGIPNLWGGSMEMILGQVKAAEELGAPLSICYCAGQYPSMPLDVQIMILKAVAQSSKVPIAISLDHGSDFDTCLRAMHFGVSAVMYDGSYLPYEENIRNTRDIIRVAHTLGVSVEGELGAVGGNATEWGKAGNFPSIHSNPEVALDFIDRTGVDFLAISFGNKHGLYQGKVSLNFELVKKIRGMTDVPLVMHGASDLADDMYPKIVESGITKIHFWSGPSKLAVQNLAEKIKHGKEPIGYQDVYRWNVEFFYEITRKYLLLLNAGGKF